MKIQGQTALVTGASRGIGRAIALELAKQGIQRIVLVARKRRRLQAVAAEVEQLGARWNTKAVVLPLDLTKPVEVNIAIAQAWRDHGPIQLLVNCAGVAHQTPFLESHLPHVEEELAINLVGTYTVTRLLARRMAAQRQGRIVNVSSLMGKVGAPTMATYSATKFALVGFTQALRGELSPHNVQVTALLPFLTDTDMAQRLQWFRGATPTTPERVAKALVKGLQRSAPEILVGWQSQLAVWCDRLAPGLLEQIMRLTAPTPAKSAKSGRGWRLARNSSR